VTRPGTELFVARDRLQAAGFVLVAPFGMAGSPYIASLAVMAEARGEGIGSELLRFAEERFAASGHIFLLVSSFNRGAERLYRQHGYEFVGELKDYVATGYSELILHKRLK
jgi:ribosomal protein S18 acetylase RimI-like enzyme